METTVVIPNWNGLRFLQPLFEDLRAQTVTPSAIIVVDNGSTDGSVAWAEAAGASVAAFRENRGFAAAVNAGAGLASTELIAIVNNDVRLDARWLESILAGLGSGAFAVGKVLSLSNPDRIDATFDAVCKGGAAWRCGAGRPDGPEWSVSRDIQFAPFTAVAIRRRAFLDAGGLDESFESYLEDVDFGFRCGSKGYSGRYVPEAVAWHVGSGTLGYWNPQTVRQIARNQVFLVARHYPGPLVRRFGWRIAVAQLLWGAVACRYGRLAPWMAGKWEGVRRFRELRRSGSDRVAAMLETSEREMRLLQERTGFDAYWRVYFALTR